MKEAVTKVIDTITQEDFHGAFQKLLERYNKCIATGGDYFEGDWSFMYVLSIKVPIWKSLKTYRVHLVYIYIYNQSASEDSGCGLLAYGIYEEYHINLWEYSIYTYWYISFSIPVYITKLT